MVVVVIASRLVWMLSGPVTTRIFGRVTEATVWRERTVVAWAGMRGGLSLAAALAIPLRLTDGRPFPNRDLVIVVAASVIVASLLIQGTSLPWLLRRLDLRADDFGTAENQVRLKAARAALAWLDDPQHADATDEATKAAQIDEIFRLTKMDSLQKQIMEQVKRMTPSFMAESGIPADAQQIGRELAYQIAEL